MNIAVIDIVFASLVVILVIRCFLKGFIEEFMSMAALVLGLIFAFIFFKPGALFLTERFGVTVLPELASFSALFVIAFVVVKILEHILGDIIDRVNLTSVDRALGFVLGLVEGLLVVCFSLFVLSVQPLFDPAELLDGSLFARYLMPLVSLAGESAAAAVKGT